MEEACSRPDYENFLSSFSEKLGIENRDVCFYVYGSYLRHSFIPGVSDIDGGLILPGGPVSSRKKVISIARSLDMSLDNLDIDFDINLTDRKTNNDGRFLSYSKSMTDYIKTNGKVFSGPQHLIESFNGLDYRNEDLKHSSMILRSLRNLLLGSYYESRRNYENFEKRVRECLQKAVKFPKQLVLLKQGELIVDNVLVRNRLGRMLKDYISDDALDTLGSIESTLKNKRVFKKLIKNTDGAVILLQDALESIELITDAYLRQFPQADYNECRN